MIPDQRLPGKCTKQKKCFSPKTKKKGKKDNWLTFYITEEIFFS